MSYLVSRSIYIAASLLLPAATMAATTTVSTSTPNSSDSDSSNTIGVSSTIYDMGTLSQANATQAGEIYVYTSGDRTGSFSGMSSADASWNTTVTNSTTDSRDYILNFSTGSGRISFSSHTNPGTGELSTSGTSSLSYGIMVDGVTIWESFASLTEAPGPVNGTAPNSSRSIYEFAQSGYNLDGVLDLPDWEYGDSWGYTPGSYEFEASDVSINLGTLLAGESLDIVFFVNSTTEDVDLGLAAAGTDSWAEIVSSETPVPLPAALPLFLSGMGFLALSRRRKSTLS